jgi:hypothetical protein
VFKNKNKKIIVPISTGTENFVTTKRKRNIGKEFRYISHGKQTVNGTHFHLKLLHITKTK